MSNTPETDKAERMAWSQEYMVPTEFARNLERERDEANEELHKQLVQFDHLFDEAEKIRIERDEARNAIVGWENKWKCAVDMAARAEIERDEAINKLKELKDILR